MFARFWYFVVATVAGVALALAFLGHAAFEREGHRNVDENVRRDRYEMDLWLKRDALERLAAIRPMTVNTDIASGLDESNGRTAGQLLAPGTRTRVEATLGSLNRQLGEGAADILIAVDKDGDIVAQVGGGVPALNANVRDLPMAMEALHGNDKDDLWLRDDVLLRALARPVLRAGVLVGAIVYATEIDDDLSRRLATELSGPSVAFFRGDSVIAFMAGEHAPSRVAITQMLAEGRRAAAQASNERTAPLPVGENGLGVVALFHEKPINGTVGFVVARALPVATSPLALLSEAPSEDVSKLPWAFVILLPLVLGLLGLAFSMIERDRPLAKLHAAIKEIAKSGSGRVPSGDFRGPFRMIAEDVNDAVSRVGQTSGAAAAQRRSTNLDELLGGSPAPSGGNDYFGFASKPGSDVIPDIPAAPPAAKPVTRGAPIGASAPAPVPAAPPVAPPRVSAPPKPAPPKPAPPAPAPPPPRAPAPAAQTLPDYDKPEMGHEDEDDDAQTMIAEIPRELLAASGETDLEVDHFRQVFDEFVAVKEQCHEPTAGVTFDKFIVTLRRNKEQIVSKHGAKSVRFTVYVKDGKAALKATPVK